MTHKDYDVLVVGARCAGAATALQLARQGLRVLAVDRADYGADTLSTHALMRAGVLLLDRWGVLPRIVEAGTPAVRRVHFHYGEEEFPIDLRPADGIDALYAPRRTLLDSALVDAAVEAGAEIRHGHDMVGLLREPSGRVIGASLLDAEGQVIRISCNLVVGADGAGSAVARQVEAATLHRGQHAAPVIYGYWSGLPRSGYHWHYNEGAGAGCIETNAGQHCVFVSAPRDHFGAAPVEGREAQFRHILAYVAPELAREVAAAAPQGALHGFAGRKAFLRECHGPGWALVGDAGYFKDPITAHGITDALRDAALLADAIAQGDMRRYATTRDRLSLPLFNVTDEIAGYGWDLDRLQSLHRGLNAAMKQEVSHLLTMDALFGEDVA